MFNHRSNVSTHSELELIERIQQWLGAVNPPAPEGLGDDCAVHSPGSASRQIMTTDALTYGQHFDHSVPAREAGAKLVNRNLSDIAAMGGVPDRAVLNLLFGPDLALDWLEAFFAGLRAAAEAGGLKIVGGDLSRLEPGRFSSVLTVLGTADAPLLRRTARPGDAIFVTGSLGGSLAGKHYRFAPRLSEGQWLARGGRCTSLIDVTDGLAKDLPGLLPENLSASIDLAAIPISDDARKAAADSGRSALEHAFRDGEDYELLFTVDAATDPADFAASWKTAFPGLRLSHIGRVIEGAEDGKLVDASGGVALPWTRGFEHFPGES